MNNIETRLFNTDVRAEQAEGEPLRILGHGAVFNTRSENLGGFREVIAPGAFDEVLGDDVRALFNHDQNIILGRSTAETLSLGVDDQGLHYDISPPDTQLVRDMVLTPMRRGEITQSSFAFRVARHGDDWDEDEDGVIVRTIHKIQRLFDVSPVTYPAYPTADSALRSMQAWQEAKQEGALKRAIDSRDYRERVLALIR